MTVFLTGFPGFLGSALVERLLARGETVACLVQETYREQAERRATELAGEDWDDRIALYEGDITEVGLGLGADDRKRLQASVGQVFHLAAVYDLGVEAALAEAVNVRGTEHVLAFAEGVADLERFQYVSTCYVGGRHDGVFAEADLDVGQSFNNHYERTKFLAERRVQERMAEGLPATVYRPAITVGDSRTGETQKYDGPYYVLQWIRRQGPVAFVPRFPGADRHTVNVVPRDYVVDAIDALSAMDRSEGTVYQLCDPNPPTVAHLLDTFAAATDTRVVGVPAPPELTERLLAWPPVRRIARIEPETIPYFAHPTEYVCGNARQDLADTDVTVPPIDSYVDRLMAFVEAHPEIAPDAMT